MEPVLRRFDARDYLRILTKRKWFVIMVALAAGVIGGLYTVSYPKTYRAAAIVIIRRQGQPIIWVGDKDLQGPQREDLALETQARIAASIDCAQAAADQLCKRTTGDAIQVSAGEIAASIAATPHEPDLLRIEAVHRDQRYAIEFANEVARAFVSKNKDLRVVESKAAKEFLNDALTKSRDLLDRAQGDLAAYQEQVGIVLADDEPQSALQQLRLFQNSLADAQANLSAARSDRQVLAGRLEHMPAYRTESHEVPNPRRQALLQELQATQLQLTRLRAQYTDNWPAVQNLKDQVDELNAQLAREPETTTSTSVEPEPAKAELRRDLVAMDRKVADLQARVAALSGTVSGIEASKQTMPGKLARLNRLMSRVKLAEVTFQNVQAQLENARLNEAMKQSDAEVIDHAAAAAEVSPRLGRMLLFSLTLGLAAGVALALFLEALDDTLHGPEDIAAYTEVAFLGMVPLLEDPAQGLITVVSPKSPPAEAYRTLRSNIHFAQVDHPARTFLVTSAGAGEGKTMTAANLAVVMAQSGQEVLLVDTDLRRPSLHRVFNVSSERGLTNVLVGESDLDDVLLETDVPGLRVVTSGPLPPNPAELLESEQMGRVIAEAQDLADMVIFDSPPAIVLTDAIIMSSKVERTILVAEAGQVTRDAFNEMCRLITNARGVILGVVLNKLRLSAGDYYYYYYYYDYSHSPRPAAEAIPFVPQGASQPDFVSPDSPSVLDEMFGYEDAQPPVPQRQVSSQAPPPEQPPALGPAPRMDDSALLNAPPDMDMDQPAMPAPTPRLEPPPIVQQPPTIEPPPVIQQPPVMDEPPAPEPPAPEVVPPVDEAPAGQDPSRPLLEDLFGPPDDNETQ